jgi:hypothetical protein
VVSRGRLTILIVILSRSPERSEGAAKKLTALRAGPAKQSLVIVLEIASSPDQSGSSQ